MTSRVEAFLYSPSEVRRGSTYTVFFWMLAIAAVLGHRAYAPMLLAPLAAIDWRHAYYARRATFRGVERHWLIYFASAALFTGYTALSAVWSPLPGKISWAITDAICFLLAPLSFHSVHYLSPAARDRAAAAVAWAALAMAGLLTFEAASNAAIRQALPPPETVVRDFVSLGRGTLLLVLLVWPARRIFAERLRRPILGWALVGVAIIPAMKFSIATNAVMLASGLVAYVAGRIVGRLAPATLFALAGLAVLATPLAAIALDADALRAAFPSAPDSWIQRLYIWERAGDEIVRHPFGGGVEYARALSRPIVPIEINGVPLNTMPLHPHNLFLHVWMDLGVVGAFALLGFIAAAARAALGACATREDAAVTAAVVAALLATATTEWSVWQVWRFAAVWIVVIAIRLAASPPPAPVAVRPGL
ncbi:MAG: O-antigen ligase family protein [Pseudomonadota bacterium]